MGFAIERTELKNGQVIERYWMRSIKRFREKDRGLPPGTPVSTADHPVQSFQWGDYTAQSSRTYRYRIVPAYGPAKNLTLDEASAVTVDAATEVEYLLDPDAANDTSRHDVYFNRGVIGSQAYARRFQNAAPNPDNPVSEEMVWLSRGSVRGADTIHWPCRRSSFRLARRVVRISLPTRCQCVCKGG